MVACGTSGLFGGRRVLTDAGVPAERAVPLPVADNSLIPAVCFPVVAFALVVRGLRAVVFLTAVFLVVAFLFAMIFSLYKKCLITNRDHFMLHLVPW
jgi:hypothetical protein